MESEGEALQEQTPGEYGSLDCRVSLLIPCFNEVETLASCVERVLDVFSKEPDLQLQLVLVDDASTDGSDEIAARLAKADARIETMRHATNLGKGAAIRSGLKLARGEIIAIQDADLEYDPGDLLSLLEPIRQGQADVVYGSRFASDVQVASTGVWHRWANRTLTWLANRVTGLHLTDMETCYKVFHRSALDGLEIEEDRFGVEPEMTCKLASRGLRFLELPIAYQPRNWRQGKKIGLRDGIRALYCLWKYRGTG